MDDGKWSKPIDMGLDSSKSALQNTQKLNKLIFILGLINIFNIILSDNWKLSPCLYHVLQYSYMYFSHSRSQKWAFLTFYGGLLITS